MCQRIGRPPISTIGLGRTPVSSLRRVPNPPARITAFIRPPSGYPHRDHVPYTTHSALAEFPRIIYFEFERIPRPLKSVGKIPSYHTLTAPQSSAAEAAQMV